ncbi:hypothetical protein LTS10_013196 [Elasticomyces elasticus]|nr:hypothetical protein LTS10_013196 [Elasticomyces elasticus]
MLSRACPDYEDARRYFKQSEIVLCRQARENNDLAMQQGRKVRQSWEDANETRRNNGANQGDDWENGILHASGVNGSGVNGSNMISSMNRDVEDPYDDHSLQYMNGIGSSSALNGKAVNGIRASAVQSEAPIQEKGRLG